MKRTLISLLGALCLLGLVASVAVAAKSYDTTVTLDYNQTQFSGKVKAGGKCQKGRRISLVHPDDFGNAQVTGEAKSDAKGKYLIDLPALPTPGRYTATAKKKTVKVNGEKHKCLAGESNQVIVAGDNQVEARGG